MTQRAAAPQATKIRTTTTAIRSDVRSRRQGSLRTRAHVAPRPLRAAGVMRAERPSGNPFSDSGELLEPGVRRFMEPRLGFDLGLVRVHRGSAAAAATSALDARAFAFGRDIAFAPGEFQPHTRAGQQLLAHELAHVGQQARTGVPRIQRQPNSAPKDWHQKLDDILPRNVGLITHIDRIMQLTERFTEDELRELVDRILGSADAVKLTRDEAGVPGIIALHETRVGKTLDVPAARFLLKTFPARRKKARKSEESKRVIFSEEIVRDAYIRFHYNALLPKKREEFVPELPAEVRRNCIAIVHDMMPKLFKSDAVIKKVDKRMAQLRKKGKTFTMVHTGEALRELGVAHKRIEVKFKDEKGKATNGNTEPKELVESAWDRIVKTVSDDYGWHIFGMAMMDGYHSVTLFVDNQPEGITLYWADQWRIEPGNDFQQTPGSISGFRRYEKKGFDEFIEKTTNRFWNEVHSSTSKCAKNNPKNWDSFCRYPATLMLWQLRKVAQR